MNQNELKERVSQLPHLSTINQINQKDYLDELILEPLSIISGSSYEPTLNSPIKNVVKNNNNQQSSPLKFNNTQINDNNDAISDSNSGDFYCNDCKKRFQSEQTWNTHINSSKHIQQVKENKKKSIGTNKSTTSPSPKKHPSSATSSSISASQKLKIDENDSFQKKQLELMTVIPSKPNLTLKNLFQAAKNYTAHHMIKDAAVCLLTMLQVQQPNNSDSSKSSKGETNAPTEKPSKKPTSNQQTTATKATNISTPTKQKKIISTELPNDLIIDIFTKISLETKTHLNFARLTRLFDRKLSEYHFTQCIITCSLIQSNSLKPQDIFDHDYLSSLLVNNHPQQIIDIFYNTLVQQQQQQQQTSTTNTESEQTKDESPLQQLEPLISMIDEIAGGLSFDRINFKSLFLYLLSYSITLFLKLNSRSRVTLQRVIRLLVALNLDYYVVDMFVLQYKVSDTVEQKQSSLINAFKYALETMDLIRLKYLIGNYSDDQLESNSSASPYVEQLQLLQEVGNAVLSNDSYEFDCLKDRFENIVTIHQDKDLFYTLSRVYEKMVYGQ